MKKPVLVVGGAGYIGSHTCMILAQRGYQPIVFDNLCNGHEEFVRWGVLEVGDVRDTRRVEQVIEKHRPLAILHFAALIEVGQSLADPLSFYDNNVIGSLNLLRAAIAGGVNYFVFSSTCATYGLPQSERLDESHRQVPINPYGRTKWIVEQALKDYSELLNIKAVILRYFNAAGADFEGRIGEWHQPETHAIPIAIEAALGRRTGFKIFGTDYQTRDGTCVRDYVHVLDLADAHVRAVDYLLAGGETEAINLGTGTGTTVKELLNTIRAVSGRAFPVEETSRRAGDSTSLVADNTKAATLLGWQPQYSIEDIVKSAWNWHTRHNAP
ncbi:UDP-glucose 4-epimerase GalE [Rhizobium glycinendophyticum]|uniref:UDP-glucose 4-epimerase n=1 Tax=Rhizobium glycinendophyticum TaxID=2589807 RepID=A0A504TR11_9HYPH|nr:UDP-glucose 4-epimerase GalE [Rhizobium glycinendophyticum]TPP03927.1 UDP-glucose 4-epimerase GalE [Rhizobium glycinendophyticum]